MNIWGEEPVNQETVDAHLLRAGVRLTNLRIEIKELEGEESALSERLKELLTKHKFPHAQKVYNWSAPIPGSGDNLDVKLQNLEVTKPVPDVYELVVALYMDRYSVTREDAVQAVAQYFDFNPTLKAGGLEAMFRDKVLTGEQIVNCTTTKEHQRLTVKRTGSDGQND